MYFKQNDKNNKVKKQLRIRIKNKTRIKTLKSRINF